MKINKTDEITVTGVSVRTNNTNEMSPSTAKIGTLWERFYADLGAMLNRNSRVFGLYTNYEADHTGDFDVVACSDSLEVDGLEEFQINSGKYLVFNETGEMPQAVINLWGKVWNYFSSDDCNHIRAFTTDFELYKNEKEVEIYISIQ